MQLKAQLVPEELSATAPLFAAVDDALELLDAERDAFLTGAYDMIAELSARKLAVLERLESVIPTAPRSATVISAVRSLIAASRRNEQIIQAARQGLTHAKRRLQSITDTRTGVVAYAEDGSRITSAADRVKAGTFGLAPTCPDFGQMTLPTPKGFAFRYPRRRKSGAEWSTHRVIRQKTRSIAAVRRQRLNSPG